jgi:hypothetical protein
MHRARSWCSGDVHFATRSITRLLCMAPWQILKGANRIVVAPWSCYRRMHSFRAAASGGGGGRVGGPGSGQTQKLPAEYVAGSPVESVRIIIIGTRFNDRSMFLTLLRAWKRGPRWWSTAQHELAQLLPICSVYFNQSDNTPSQQ